MVGQEGEGDGGRVEKAPRDGRAVDLVSQIGTREGDQRNQDYLGKDHPLEEAKDSSSEMVGDAEVQQRCGATEAMGHDLANVRLRELKEETWFDAEACESPRWIERFVEMKTIWHPSGA